MKNLKLSLQLIKLGLKSDAAFTIDFLFGLFSSILWIGIPLVFFQLLFLNVDNVNGWHYYQILTLVGVYTMIDGLMMGVLIRSMGLLEGDILSGSLDQYLLKPFDTQLFYLFRSVNLVQLTNVGFGLVVTVWSLSLQGRTPSLMTFALVLVSMIFGCAIYYAVWFVIVISAFWWPSTVSRSELFLSMASMSKYPATIFRGLVKLVLTVIFPLLLIANPAARVLVGKSYGQQLALQVIVGLAALVLCRILWQRGLSRYEGTGR
jgi:ABC-2 type transport system permease protein